MNCSWNNIYYYYNIFTNITFSFGEFRKTMENTALNCIGRNNCQASNSTENKNIKEAKIYICHESFKLSGWLKRLMFWESDYELDANLDFLP